MYYNKITKQAFLTTQDGVEIVLSCPKLSALLNIRNLIDADYLDDAETMAGFFCCLCITKYGDDTSLTFDEYLNLSMKDGLMITKCITHFLPSSELFSIWGNVLSDNGIKELRKLLLLSVENNMSDYFNLLDKDTYDVLEALEAFYENKLDEYEQTTGKKHPSVKQKGMSANQLANMGFPMEALMENLD